LRRFVQPAIHHHLTHPTVRQGMRAIGEKVRKNCAQDSALTYVNSNTPHIAEFWHFLPAGICAA